MTYKSVLHRFESAERHLLPSIPRLLSGSKGVGMILGAFWIGDIRNPFPPNLTAIHTSLLLFSYVQMSATLRKYFTPPLAVAVKLITPLPSEKQACFENTDTFLGYPSQLFWPTKGSYLLESQVIISLLALTFLLISDNENDEMILGKVHNQSKATIKPM